MCRARLALPPPFRFAPQGAIGGVNINERKDRTMSEQMVAGWCDVPSRFGRDRSLDFEDAPRFIRCPECDEWIESDGIGGPWPCDECDFDPDDEGKGAADG